MADFPVTENPQFSATMRQISTSDRGHAETFNPLYQKLLDNDNYLKDDIEQKHKPRTLTLTAAGWSSAYPYTQTVAAEGVTAEDSIKIIAVKIPENATQDQVKALNKAAGLLIYNPGGVGNGQITFRAYMKPVVDFSIITEGA